MPKGVCILYKTIMIVNNLGKIDVYAYIYFLAKHAQRHITQMKRKETEYCLNQSAFENTNWDLKKTRLYNGCKKSAAAH